MNEPNADSNREHDENQPTPVGFDPRVYHVYHDATDLRSLSGTVIESIATIRDIDPTDAPIPLVDVIDPDALDALFTETRRTENRPDERVTFTIDGLTVFVHANGHIVVLESDDVSETVGSPPESNDDISSP